MKVNPSTTLRIDSERSRTVNPSTTLRIDSERSRTVNVLGVNIDDISIDQTVKKVEGWLKGKDKHYIVTPNPEIVVMAQKDKELKNIINNADLAIPDGIGLKLSGDIVCYTPGVDLMERLILMAEEKGFTVGLLGGREGVAEKAAKRLKGKYPKLRISFAENGGELDQQGNVIARRSIHRPTKQSHLIKIATLPEFTPSVVEGVARNDKEVDLLFVAFGPPKQEKWIRKNLNKLNVKVAMGVGGAFDYLSGKIPRAPKWIRRLGLEWIFRLIIQPWRIKRQLMLLKYIWLLTKR